MSSDVNIWLSQFWFQQVLVLARTQNIGSGAPIPTKLFEWKRPVISKARQVSEDLLRKSIHLQE